MADEEYGVTPTGFKTKPFEAIKADMQEAVMQGLNDQINFDKTGSVAGIIVSSVSLQQAISWQSQEKVSNSGNPNTAEGVALDCVAAVTNSKRTPESYSYAMVEITGTAGRTIPKGWVRTVQETGARFKTGPEAEIPPEVEQPLVIKFTAEDPGPIEAPVEKLTEGAALPGVTTVSNPADAILGAYALTDGEFRPQRDEDVKSKGGGTIPSIRAALKELTGGVDPVTYVKVFENRTKLVDSAGRPGNCVHCFLVGGAHDDIIETIFLKKGAGIQAYGSITETYTDEDGQEYIIGYDRPSDINIHILVAISEIDSDFPTDGADQIGNLLAAYGAANQKIAVNVLYSYVKASYSSVKGIVNHEFYIASEEITEPGAGQQVNISITELQIARFDRIRITVTLPT
jgi:uncharacterized phage protein gp47/JayE